MLGWEDEPRLVLGNEPRSRSPVTRMTRETILRMATATDRVVIVAPMTLTRTHAIADAP